MFYLLDQLVTKSIEELAPLIRNKEISPVELTRTTLDQEKSCNGLLNAYLSIFHEEAIKDAENAEKEIMQGIYRGDVHGIPMALKDNIYFKNKITTIGSKIHNSFISSFDATVVKRLKKAGVILTGKLNMDEYAAGVTTNNSHFGSSHNPWDSKKTPGGSSGGQEWL